MSSLRFALRQLAKTPGFTAAVVLSLALGIAATATVFCWLKYMVLRPVPGAAEQTRLVVLVSNQGGGNVSLPDLEDFGRQTGFFSGAIASQISSAALTVDRHVEWINAQVVSARFFDVLGVKPILGRTFLPDEDRLKSGNPVLVISERLWRGKFRADPAIIGRQVDLNGYFFTVVGVTPSGFHGTMNATSYDVWAPLSMIWEVRNQTNLWSRSARGWHNLLRLQPGVSLHQAQAGVTALDRELSARFPDTNRDARHRLVSVSDCPWGAQSVMGPMLRLLLVVSLGVLLIVAANVSNLLLVRAAGRRKEIAIRIAAGASRPQLIRQFLLESGLLALAGGMLGVLFASWFVDSIPLFLPRALAERVHFQYPLDAAVIGLSLALTLGLGLVFGLVPALHAAPADLYAALKEGGRTSSGGSSLQRLRNGLVAAEIALALVLLVGAALCLKGFQQARRVPFGFNPAGVLAGTLQVGMNGYTPETGRLFYRRLREHLAGLPGIQEAALASWFPLGLWGCKGSGVQVEGYVRTPGENPTYEYAIVSPRYFAVMQIPLVEGRDFTDGDDERAPVAIVNEHFAQRFWPGRSAIGQKFRTRGAWWTVVGVAKAGRYNRLNEPPWCFYYLPYQAGVPELDLSVCVRTSGDPRAATDSLRGALHALDPRVDFVNTFTLSDFTQAVLIAERMTSILLVLLGSIAAVLAAMGVYGVMAYLVSQRTQEYGVRMALGARPAEVLWQVIRRGLRLALLGVAAGLVLAAAATRLLRAFLYGVSPFDVTTFAAVALGLVAIAVLACWIPARRATRVDPIAALRAD